MTKDPGGSANPAETKPPAPPPRIRPVKILPTNRVGFSDNWIFYALTRFAVQGGNRWPTNGSDTVKIRLRQVLCTFLFIKNRFGNLPTRVISSRTYAWSIAVSC